MSHWSEAFDAMDLEALKEMRKNVDRAIQNYESRKRKEALSALEQAAKEHGFAEAKIVIENWRQHYNTKRPHSALGYRPPAPAAVQWPASPPGAASPATPSIAPGPVMH